MIWHDELIILTNLGKKNGNLFEREVWRRKNRRREGWTEGHKAKGKRYRVFIKYCVFSLKFCDFSELCQFCCSAGVLPAWCVYTHWHRGKTEKGQSPEYFKIWEKTQYLMNTLYVNTRYPVIHDTTTVQRIRDSHLWNSLYSSTRENLNFIYYNPAQINYFDWHNNRLFELKNYNYTFYEWSACNNNNN